MNYANIEKYEKRLTLFIDIIGWKNEIQKKQICSQIKNAINDLESRRYAQSSNYKKELEDKCKNNTGLRLMPQSFESKCSTFSDNLVFSSPVSLEGRIFNTAASIIRDLLKNGFLARGGLTIGAIFHHDNIVFGPALNEAVNLEKEAVFPRIICSNEVIKCYKKWSKDQKLLLITDVLGRQVINPFFPDIKLDSKKAIEFAKESQYIPEITKIITHNIKQFSQMKTEGCGKRLEKWNYMKILLEQSQKNWKVEL